MNKINEISQEELDDMWENRGYRSPVITERYIIFKGKEYSTLTQASRETGHTLSHIQKNHEKFTREVK